MELKNLIAKGTSAEIYREGEDAVKVYNETVPKTDVLLEALNTVRVEDTGLPMATVKSVSVVNGRWATTMTYIEGKTLADVIKENPEQLEDYINQMVDLQIQIHSKKSPLLNKLKDKLKTQIETLTEIDDVKKYDLLTRLDGMPKHAKVCHGDFEPKNILVSNGKLYAVDWIHASQGNASADAAKTYLLLALENIKTADLYLDKFCKKTGIAKKYVQTWLPIVAAAQLTKKKPEEKELLMKWLDVVQYD